MSPRWEISVPLNALWECLEFAYKVSPHLYQRLTQSQQSFGTHIARTFFGKVGETAFATLMRQQHWHNADHVYQTMFTIFPGSTAVDTADLWSNGLRLDIKTVYRPRHRFLIVPADQWHHQPKEVYILIRTHYPDADPWATLLAYLNRHAALFPQIQAQGSTFSQQVRQHHPPSATALHDLDLVLRQLFHDTPLPWTTPITATVEGFRLRTDAGWLMETHDPICPEGSCVRYPAAALLPLDDLIPWLLPSLPA